MNNFQGGNPSPYPAAPQPHYPQAYPTPPTQASTQSQTRQYQQTQHQQPQYQQPPPIQYQQQQPVQYPQQQASIQGQQTGWPQQAQATAAPQQTPQYQSQHPNPTPQQQQPQQLSQYPQQYGASAQQQAVGYPYGAQQPPGPQQYPPALPARPYQQPTTTFPPPPLPPRPIGQPAPYGSAAPGSYAPPLPHAKTSSGMKSRFGATVAGFQSKLGGYMAKMQTPSSSAYPGASATGAAVPQAHGYGQPVGQPYGQQPQQVSPGVQGQTVPYGQTPQVVQQLPSAALGQQAQEAPQVAQGQQLLSGTLYGQSAQNQAVVGAPYGQQPQVPQSSIAQPAAAIPYGQQHVSLQSAPQGNIQPQAHGQHLYQQLQTTNVPTPPPSIPPYGQPQPQLAQTVQGHPASGAPYGQQQYQTVVAAASPGLYQHLQSPQAVPGQHPQPPQPVPGQQAPPGVFYGQQQGLSTLPPPTAALSYSQHSQSVHMATTSGYAMQSYQAIGSSASHPASSIPAVAALPVSPPSPLAQGLQHPAHPAQPNTSLAALAQTGPQGYPPANAATSPPHSQTFQVPYHSVGTAASLPGSPAPASPPPSSTPVGLPMVGTASVGTPAGPTPVSYSQAPPPWVSQAASRVETPHTGEPTNKASGPVSPPAQIPADGPTAQQVTPSSNPALTSPAPMSTQQGSRDSRLGEVQQPARSSQPSVVIAHQATAQSSPVPATQPVAPVDTGGTDHCWPTPTQPDECASRPPDTEIQQPVISSRPPPVPEKVPDVSPSADPASGPVTDAFHTHPTTTIERALRPSQATAGSTQEKANESHPVQAIPDLQSQQPRTPQDPTHAFPPQDLMQPSMEPLRPISAQTYAPQILLQPLTTPGQRQATSGLPRREQPAHPSLPSAQSSNSTDTPQPALTSLSLSSLTTQIESLLVSGPPQTSQTSTPAHQQAIPQAGPALGLPPISNNPYPASGEVVITDYFPFPMLTAPFSNTPKTRACMGNAEVSGLRKWYSHPSAPYFNVCEYCYDIYVAQAKFASEFTLKEQNNLRCGFHVLRITRVLWPKALESSNISAVLGYMKRRSSAEVKFCGGPGGNPKSDGIKWYDCEEEMPVYGVCEACYEDVFVGGPFEKRLSVCRREQPEEERWNCGNWNDSYTRLILKGDWERFVSHVNDRVKLGPCDGELKSAQGTRWWTVRGMGPQADIHICATCYHDIFKDSRSEGIVEPLGSVPYQQLACDCNPKNNMNLGMAVYFSESRKLGAEELRRVLFATLSRPRCGTRQPFENGRYYNIRGSAIDSYGVCEACYESRISVLGLRPFFTETPHVVPGPTYCVFNPAANRCGLLLTQFVAAVQTGVWSTYEDCARVLISSPNCEGINAMKSGRWWGWPDCTVCETCFYGFACNTKLAADMPLQGITAGPEEYHICGLFSNGQRKRYLQTCQKGDLPEFLEFCRERQVKWGELWPAIQRLQAEISRTYWAGDIASISSHSNRTSDAITFGMPTTQYVTSSGNRYNSYRGVIAEQEAAQAEVLYKQSISPREEQARLLAIWGMWE